MADGTTTAEVLELPRKPDLGRVGWSGTPSTPWGGRPSDHLEHNVRLRGAEWALIVEKMKRTSAAVFVGWFAMRGLLQSATFKAVRPHEDASQELADLVNEAMGWDGQPGHMLTPWSRAHEVALESVPLGWRILEIVWRYEAGQWWPTLEDREPWTLLQWDDRDGVLHGIQQTSDVFGRWEMPYIPSSKFVLFNWNVTGRNHEGMGFFRPVWKDWEDLIKVQTILIAACDRYGLPPLDIELDAEILSKVWPQSPDRPFKTWGEWAEVERDALATQARNMRANEQGYITRYKGFGVKPLYSGGFDPDPLLRTIGNKEHNILRGMLSQHLLLGTTGSGSRAVGDTHEDVRRSAAVHINYGLAEVLEGPPRPGGGLIGQIVHYNVGKVATTELPVIEVDGITQPEWVRRLEMLPQLLDGWLTPTDDDEDALRAGLGMRTREASVTRTPAERLAARTTANTGQLAAPAAGDAAPGRSGRRSAAEIARERREQRRQQRQQPAEQTDDEEAEE